MSCDDVSIEVPNARRTREASLVEEDYGFKRPADPAAFDPKGTRRMDFMIEPSQEDLRKEREKARELRRSQWWKNRIAEGRCYYCGMEVPAKELTLDHVVPLVRGGRSTKGNCVAACKECNSKKQHLLPIEWDDYLLHLREE